MILALIIDVTIPALSRLAYRTTLLAITAVGFATLFAAARAFGGDMSLPGIPEPVVRGAGHFTVYGLLAVALAMATGRQFLFAWLLVMLLATAEELHQLVIPYRYCGIADWLINLAGVTTWLTAAWLWSPRHPVSRAVPSPGVSS